MSGQLETVRDSIGDVHKLAGDFDEAAGSMQVRSRMLQRQVGRFTTSANAGTDRSEDDDPDVTPVNRG